MLPCTQTEKIRRSDQSGRRKIQTPPGTWTSGKENGTRMQAQVPKGKGFRVSDTPCAHVILDKQPFEPCGVLHYLLPGDHRSEFSSQRTPMRSYISCRHLSERRRADAMTVLPLSQS